MIAVAGGTAYAANTVFSTDIVNGEVKSVDIGTGQVQSADVRNEGLTGADIADQSGVDTCEISGRITQLCVRAENFDRTWFDAAAHCANIDMRLPTFGEAFELAQTHDIPNVDQDEGFWSDEIANDGNLRVAYVVFDDGSINSGVALSATNVETLCVTTPTN